MLSQSNFSLKKWEDVVALGLHCQWSMVEAEWCMVPQGPYCLLHTEAKSLVDFPRIACPLPLSPLHFPQGHHLPDSWR